MKRLLAAAWLSGWPAAAYADLAGGRAGAEFLRIVASPRSVGMGESGVALSDDPLSALALNPAGLARLRYGEAAFTYNEWTHDVSLQHAALALPSRRLGSLALSATMLRSEPLDGIDNSAVPSRPVKAQDLAVQAAYAHRLAGPDSDRGLGLFAGAALKFARSELDTVHGDSLLYDAGLLYSMKAGPGTASAGASAVSVGQGPRFDDARDAAPSFYRGGLAYSLPVWGDPLTLAYDFRRASDQEFGHSVGLEMALRGILFWRGGYLSNQYLGSGWRFGMGFRLKVINVDYALSHYGRFGFTHLIGVAARFGQPVDVTPILTEPETQALRRVRRAREMIRQRRSYDAALELNEALSLDPRNQEALRLLREVRDSMGGPR